MDFVSARTADGRWFRTLTVIDVFTRESLALIADRSLTRIKVAATLTPIAAAWRADRDTYHRGRVKVLDWSGLEAASCERLPRGDQSAARCYVASMTGSQSSDRTFNVLQLSGHFRTPRHQPQGVTTRARSPTPRSNGMVRPRSHLQCGDDQGFTQIDLPAVAEILREPF